MEALSEIKRTAALAQGIAEIKSVVKEFVPLLRELQGTSARLPDGQRQRRRISGGSSYGSSNRSHSSRIQLDRKRIQHHRRKILEPAKATREKSGNIPA